MAPEELKNLVQALLQALGASTEALFVSNGPRTVVQIRSADSKQLIGPHGEHLQALNTIARRLAERSRGEAAANFLIDINDYHESRLQTLRENALLLAQRARLFKHDVEMSPMSSYERLVIHELFAEDPEIQTESHGEGKTRHIVLKYKISSPSFEQGEKLQALS